MHNHARGEERENELEREREEDESGKKTHDFAALILFVIFCSRFCFNKTLTSVRFECAKQPCGTDRIVW